MNIFRYTSGVILCLGIPPSGPGDTGGPGGCPGGKCPPPPPVKQVGENNPKVGSAAWSPKAALEYIKGLENRALNFLGKSKPHALTKHGWETPDSVLKEAATKSPGSAQTRFLDADEMASSIKTTIEKNLEAIEQQAAKGAAGKFPLDGPEVNYIGFKEVGGQISKIYGQGPVRLIIQFDGAGGWRLLTAFPVVVP